MLGHLVSNAFTAPPTDARSAGRVPQVLDVSLPSLILGVGREGARRRRISASKNAAKACAAFLPAPRRGLQTNIPTLVAKLCAARHLCTIRLAASSRHVDAQPDHCARCHNVRPIYAPNYWNPIL